MRTFEIIQMDKHFLYLPYYYASENNFFGYLPRDAKMSIRTSPVKTDEDTYARLMDVVGEKNSDVHFAITDPVRVLPQFSGRWTAVNGNPTPVVLASMITNAAFWVIDRKSRKILSFRDLSKYSALISFKQGTTSYGIAWRVFSDASKDPMQHVRGVDPSQELTALRQSEPGVAALTPDLLGLMDLLWDDAKTFGLDLALGTTPEYSNVLVTALLTRRDIIEKHEDVVDGLVRALQRAMTTVRFNSSEVVKFASSYFMEPNTKKVERAVQWATDSEVFPPSIEISQGHWSSACRAAADSLGAPYDEKFQAESTNAYRQFIEPYASRTRKIVKEVVLDPIERAGKPLRSRIQRSVDGVVALCVAFLIGVFITGPTLWPPILAMVVGVGAVLILPRVAMARRLIRINVFRWGMWACAVLVAAVWGMGWIGYEVGLPLVVTFLVSSLSSFMTTHGKDRPQSDS